MHAKKGTFLFLMASVLTFMEAKGLPRLLPFQLFSL